MNRQIWLAIGWAIFGVAASRYAELFSKGIGFVDVAVILLVAPVVEEFTKFLGYRRLAMYTILVPIVFSCAESIVKAYERNMATSDYVSAELFFFAVLEILAGLAVLKHIAFWSLPYLFKFKWWSYLLAVGSHSAWNAYFLLTTGRSDAHMLFAPLIILIILPFAFVLIRESHFLKWDGAPSYIAKEHRTWRDILKFTRRAK